jgi:D-psicose/D-tagatose/L-ribulose 3-epimerase
MLTYSVTQWIYGNEPLEKSLERLRRYGYDGVELAGEPHQVNLDEVRRLLADYSLRCGSICGIYTPERDLSSANPEVRANAVKYVKDCVDMAVSLGATLVIVVPSHVGKNGPTSTIEEEWGHAVASLIEAGQYALTRKVQLAVESLNRFETYLVNRLGDALNLVKQVNVGSVKLMADLFHMGIEERNHSAALRAIAPYLIHVHIADNTREAAGLGMTDFKDVLRTLLDIGYNGFITMEFMPSVANPYLTALQDSTGAESHYDHYTEQSINHIKHIAKALIGDGQ